MNIEPAEIATLGGILAAAGTGIWRGLVLILSSAKEQRDAIERMHGESTSAIKDCAVAMVKQADSGIQTAHALGNLSKAVDGLTLRVVAVERHVAERPPTARIERDPPEPSRVPYEPEFRTRP